jgi:hypothetical protein
VPIFVPESGNCSADWFWQRSAGERPRRLAANHHRNQKDQKEIENALRPTREITAQQESVGHTDEPDRTCPACHLQMCFHNTCLCFLRGFGYTSHGQNTNLPGSRPDIPKPVRLNYRLTGQTRRSIARWRASGDETEAAPRRAYGTALPPHRPKCLPVLPDDQRRSSLTFIPMSAACIPS